MSDSFPLRDILKPVSRSFYLSIQFLPETVRPSIGLAYLLARTSDTIADAGDTTPSTSLELLKGFQELLENSLNDAIISRIQSEVRPKHSGEMALLNALPECVQLFHQSDPWEQSQTLELLSHIIRGQSFDVDFFGHSESCRAFPNPATLDEYTYCVAGSVGEFWTRICYERLPNYSTMPGGDLLPLGRNFGKALQLVNILRDMPEDLRAGRCYLPENELEAFGIRIDAIQNNPSLAQPVFDLWLTKATALIQDAPKYISTLRNKRVRFACAVPYFLGIATLQLLKNHSPLETAQRLKVSRSTVRKTLFRALITAFSNAPLRRER